MELFIWPSDFGLPSFDFECLQFMVASKLCAAPISFVPSRNPRISKSGTFPCFKNGNEQITDFEEFTEFLRNSKQDLVLDSDITESQRCEFDAYTSLLKQKLYPAMLHTFWLDQSNYGTVTNYWFSSHVMFPWNFYYIERWRRRAQTYVESIGRTETTIIRDAIQALNMLSSKLGDNKYFCGDKPCSLDALIFGYLAPLLKAPLPSDRLQLHLSSMPNLVRFVESIISIYLPLSEEQIRQQSTEKRLWSKRKMQAQKVAEELKLRNQQKHNEEEQEKDSSYRDALLFGAFAIVLSVVFAVHTGIISVVREEEPNVEIVP
uniref:Metaxin n=1 Tax=Acrobeloides nanus TaxID=290746 RepID=A0A914E1T5_9BILA